MDGSEAAWIEWECNDSSWDNSHLHEKFKPFLDSLKPGNKVAVITMTGSCCPITKAHCMAFEVARSLLKDRAPEYTEVLGALALNTDGHVSNKFHEKGEEIIEWTSRAMLVRLATEETSWLSVSHLKESQVVWDLQQSWECIDFVQYHLNGADDVLNYEKWTWAVDENNRFIALGRPTYTERLRELAPETPLFLIGPELPDISSSQVRDALYEEDFEALAKLLHPAVVAWCLHHSPYRRCKRQRRIAQDRLEAQRKRALASNCCLRFFPQRLFRIWFNTREEQTYLNHSR